MTIPTYHFNGARMETHAMKIESLFPITKLLIKTLMEETQTVVLKRAKFICHDESYEYFLEILAHPVSLARNEKQNLTID